MSSRYYPINCIHCGEKNTVLIHEGENLCPACGKVAFTAVKEEYYRISPPEDAVKEEVKEENRCEFCEDS